MKIKCETDLAKFAVGRRMSWLGFIHRPPPAAFDPARKAGDNDPWTRLSSTSSPSCRP